MPEKLKNLLLFLMFKDKYAEKTYSIESNRVLLVMAGTLATLELVLAGWFFWLLQVSMALTVLAFVGLIYVMLQVLHLYDFFRARRAH